MRKSFIYFDHAAEGALPARVAAAMTAHLGRHRDRGAADWTDWEDAIETTRGKVAAFIGAAPAEISFLPNTSWALNMIALAYRWQPGDNVVTNDMEFASNAYPWMIAERRGIERRVATSIEGRVTAEALAEKIDSRTRVVAVSWVAFHNGWVYPLEEIARAAHAHGAILVVDAIQGLGALPMDVRRLGIDVLAADSHKWLLGPECCTTLYVSERVADRLPPIVAGWWNTRGGNGLDYSLEFLPGGRRFEPGLLPVDHVVGLGTSIELLSEMRTDAIRDRILDLVGMLRDGLRARGWRIATPEPLASGILAAVPPAADADHVADYLVKRGIIVSIREGAIRFAPHASNDRGEVERLLSALDERP